MTVGKFSRKKFGGISYSTWEEWDPQKYLLTYFKKLGPDSVYTLKFLVREVDRIKKIIPHGKFERALDFGCGPTIFGAAVLSEMANEIHLCDYLISNLLELEKWTQSDPDGFDWTELIEFVNSLEGKRETVEEIAKKIDLLRIKSRLYKCDASLVRPLGNDQEYPLVVSTFCADSATNSKEIWKIYTKNIFNLIETGGYGLITSLRNCEQYKNGDKDFPSANINEKDFRDLLLEVPFEIEDQLIEICEVPECAKDGFSSMIFLRFKKGIFKPAKPFRKRIEKLDFSS